MRKILLSHILLLMITLVPLHQTSLAKPSSSNSPSVIKQLEKESHGTLEVTWSKKTNTPSILKGRLTAPSRHSSEWIAYEFLNKKRKLFGLQNPRRDLKVVKIDRLHEKTIVHLQRLLFRTPVWEDYILVEINNHDGVIERIEATVHPNLEKRLFNRPMHPAISSKKAINKAMSSIKGESVKESSVESYYLATRPGTPLVYVVKLQHLAPARMTTIMIHSVTGRIIEQKTFSDGSM